MAKTILKRKKLLVLRVAILTEEFAIRVAIGTRADIRRYATKYLGSPDGLEDKYRGFAFNCLPDRNPLIIIDGDLPADIAIATVAREASHAMDFIADYISMNDRSGEFHAHGIAAVMRAVGARVFRS